MIGELVAVVGGHGTLSALVAGLGEQLFDAGLADSDPAAGTWGAPAENAAENTVRFLANPGLRALSLLVAGPGGTGTAYELAVALALAVLPIVLAGAVTPSEPVVAVPRVHGMDAVGTHASATVRQPRVHPATGVLVTIATGALEGGEQMTGQALESVRAEALFVSDVQRSDRLTADEVRAAVLNTVRRYGTRTLAALVAAEYGEHPEIAVGRMSWALGAIRAAYPAREEYPTAA